MVVPVRSCCFFFSLRQGTMLIAVVELILSAFLLFLLLLGSAHAQEMAAVLEADIEESEKLVTDDETVDTNNEYRLHDAQHLALFIIIALYTGIAMVTIHLISCVLLLYGAIMQIRQFILPWISIVVISLVVSFIGLLVYMFMSYRTQAVLIIFSLIIQIRFCLWLVVFSFYRQVYEEQTPTCALMSQEDMLSIKAGYPYGYIYGKPSNV